jgi:hypothetical protein
VCCVVCVNSKECCRVYEKIQSCRAVLALMIECERRVLGCCCLCDFLCFRVCA